jgi:hypothetical protein
VATREGHLIRVLAQRYCERGGQGGRDTTRDGSIWWSDVARKATVKMTTDGQFSRERVANARHGKRGSQGGLAPHHPFSKSFQQDDPGAATRKFQRDLPGLTPRFFFGQIVGSGLVKACPGGVSPWGARPCGGRRASAFREHELRHSVSASSASPKPHSLHRLLFFGFAETALTPSPALCRRFSCHQVPPGKRRPIILCEPYLLMP